VEAAVGSDQRLTYTVDEVAALVGIARSTLYESVRRGEVASIRIGRRIVLTRPTVEALLGFVPPAPVELDGGR
jgi:excisionase family DNA binding protein